MLLYHGQKQKGKGSLARDNLNGPTICTCDGGKGSMVAVSVERISSPPEFRKQKVLSIRRQLRKGTYNLDEHLFAAIDKVLCVLRK